MKKIFCFIALLFLLLNETKAQDVAGISRVHYFYNSGWLVETDKHLLLFDFIPSAEAAISFATLQQELKKGLAANKKLFIFISHDHEDHFNKSIFWLGENNRNVEFVLGWKPAKTPSVAVLSMLNPGDSLVKKEISVFTHPATDDGSAFLVKIDSLSIYHAGDHALWVEELVPQFSKELLEMKNKAGKIDLAFIPAARGMFTKCAVDSTIEKGVQISAAILQPTVTALQHIGCADKLAQYGQTAEKLAAIKTHWIAPARYNVDYKIGSR
ncbi:MAG: MBL fold metallo-hydrolase [Chitinophagaceae bacterium]|nr:MAG: MBL fold metallo-hydrolase [Chitinophagaceae bacterium]